MMTFDHLERLAQEWSDLIPSTWPQEGTVALLRTSRSLFAHSWYDYEFMVVAALVGFQALEAAFHFLFPDMASEAPFRRMVDRARSDGILEPKFVDLAGRAVELRNLLSHPKGAAAFTVGMAGQMLEQTHRLTALVVATGLSRASG